MKNIYVFILFFVISSLVPLRAYSLFYFISEPKELDQFKSYPTAIIVASTGRSGSTLLTACLEQAVFDRLVLKTHILPPEKDYKGKILFIFSNPDKAAESALHLTINNYGWGRAHFYHMQSSDMNWLNKIEETTKQNLEDNLLSYDALGCADHLSKWFSCENSKPEEAKILAIKYENLWDEETIQAIRDFLNLPNFYLPEKKERGYKDEELDPRELLFREHYNLGTKEDPCYKAYDTARIFWKEAPAIQYFKLK